MMCFPFSPLLPINRSTHTGFSLCFRSSFFKPVTFLIYQRWRGTASKKEQTPGNRIETEELNQVQVQLGSIHESDKLMACPKR